MKRYDMETQCIQYCYGGSQKPVENSYEGDLGGEWVRWDDAQVTIARQAERIAELERQVVELERANKLTVNETIEALHDMSCKLEVAEEKVAELERDRERLDWLEAQGGQHLRANKETVREAIDTAARATCEEETE